VGFYNSLSAGAKSEAEKLGYSYTYQGAATFSPTAQTPVVRAVCAKKPKILLIAPTDPVALRPAIQSCMDEGVKVVTVDTSLTNTQGLISQVSSNNIQGGAAAADLVGAKLGGKGQVAILSLDPTTTTQAQRVKGFKDELAKKYPGISVVASEYTGQPVTVSETDARAILTAHQDVKAFFGAAEPNALGVAQVLTSMGKTSSILNVGYDADPTEVTKLKSGAIAALIIQQPALEGSSAVKFANDDLTGKTSSIKKSLLLPNIVVTTAKASDPASTKYYYSGS